MKRTLLSVLTASLITSAALAQSAFAPEIGLNLPNLKITGPLVVATTSIKPGALVGGNFDIHLSDQFIFCPGIFYRMNGANLKSDHTSKFFINSLEVPLDFWYRFGPSGTSVFCLGAGPYLAANLAAKITWDAYTDMYRTPQPAGSGSLKIGYKEGDDIKRYDAGLSFNAAYLLKSGLFFRARYQFGFFDMNQPDQGFSIKMNAISISFGYHITDKGKKKTTTAPTAPVEKKKSKKKVDPYQNE